ncbi:SCP2 sterol-binding domain-containing protein [Parvularcula lutaonensis]|uniref:SCP2 sterol-binding domain-containing protein n=1 Tax=Parvularcula lutaonensis TaxID=491923 RepID=A0ABV7M9Z6_9PROT|nr:SCP2 sterol-binding domain-containing protein [Parvularcula lutaonensis]GGY44764.1 hypothetical protein GCM10007148_12110 [Parvularcula lutaonensis]
MSSAADGLREGAEKGFVSSFDGVLRIECTEDGSSLWIDGRGDSPSVSEKAPPELEGRFCLWRGEVPVLRSVLLGQRKLETALMAGQLKISGDMAVMARLELGEPT